MTTKPRTKRPYSTTTPYSGPFGLRLPMAHLEEVDSRAAQLGLSRGRLIKIAVEHYLSSTPKK